jgi:hypothetical protein
MTAPSASEPRRARLRTRSQRPQEIDALSGFSPGLALMPTLEPSPCLLTSHPAGRDLLSKGAGRYEPVPKSSKAPPKNSKRRRFHVLKWLRYGSPGLLWHSLGGEGPLSCELAHTALQQVRGGFAAGGGLAHCEGDTAYGRTRFGRGFPVRRLPV